MSIFNLFQSSRSTKAPKLQKKVLNKNNSEQLFKKALTLFPGGVNSPVRAFKSVFGSPLFIKKGDGAHIWDEDDNKFIDFCCSWGPLIHGHNHPKVRSAIEEALVNGTSFGAPTRKENELADFLISRIPHLEKVRFVSSGTEAVMSAIRLARGYTKRRYIVKFEGCYHGHSDQLLVKAGSGLVTFGETSSAGVTEKMAAETLVLPLNDKAALEACFAEYGQDIAGVIIEPIPANNGLLLQETGFLQALRDICTQNQAVLIFDEVISGFRVGFSGAAGHYGITPDLVTYGKIIGGGLPVGAYGGKAEIMAHISPEGAVYQAGTLSGNPLAMSSGLAAAKLCAEPGFYEKQEKRTKDFVNKIMSHTKDKGYKFNIHMVGSIFWIAFSDAAAIRKAEEIDADMTPFKLFHKALLERGVYLGPSGYEVGFVSTAHSEAVLNQAAEAFVEAVEEVMG
jgi:glutamate-1-semialdehyde 2,1-aminomutase